MANQQKYHDLLAFLEALHIYQSAGLTCINGERFVNQDGILVPVEIWDKKNPRPYYEPAPLIGVDGSYGYSGVITIDHNK